MGLRSDVVFRIAPSVGAWDKTPRAELSVTRQTVYAKLKRVELPIAAGLVEYSGRELGVSLQQMPTPPPVLPGYRVRVLEGNHLAGTEHRLLELRRYRAAALPGHALVFYDPQWAMVTEVIPYEDAYAPERALLPEVVPMVRAGDCIVADRNFCTPGFLFGIVRRGAFFVIRQHGSNVVGQWPGKRRAVGQHARGQALYEQALCITETDTGTTLVVRRITVALATPTRQGETEIHRLTNLPPADASAPQLSAVYADRWTSETAFQHLTVDLACEVDTLGYPKAALGFRAVLPTWGQTLLHHPHLHCLVPGGGIALDGTRWLTCRPGFFLPVRVLSRLFRRLFLQQLDHAYTTGQLPFSGTLASLHEPQAFAAYLAPVQRSEWVVYTKKPFGSAQRVLDYLGRYTHRVAIAKNRLISMDDEQITFRSKDYRQHDKHKRMTLTPTEFIRRFLLHVLPRGFQRIRHFGFLGNRYRQAKLDVCHHLLAMTPRAPVSTSRVDYRDRYEQLTGKSLRVCPVCTKGQMVPVETLPACPTTLVLGWDSS